jgi:hypothetical protein
VFLFWTVSLVISTNILNRMFVDTVLEAHSRSSVVICCVCSRESKELVV